MNSAYCFRSGFSQSYKNAGGNNSCSSAASLTVNQDAFTYQSIAELVHEIIEGFHAVRGAEILKGVMNDIQPCSPVGFQEINTAIGSFHFRCGQQYGNQSDVHASEGKDVLIETSLKLTAQLDTIQRVAGHEERITVFYIQFVYPHHNPSMPVLTGSCQKKYGVHGRDQMIQ